MKENRLDKLDKRILRELQKNGKISNQDLANNVGISPSPCLRRVKLMEERNIIKKYVALLEPNELHKKLVVYARGTFTDESSEVIERFKFEVKTIPQIMECYFVTGECDFIIKVLLEDLAEYNTLRKHYLSKINGVKSITTEVSLECVKYSTEIYV